MKSSIGRKVFLRQIFQSVSVLSFAALNLFTHHAHAEITSCEPLTKVQRGFYKFYPGHYVEVSGIKYRTDAGVTLNPPIDSFPDGVKDIKDIQGIVGIQKRYYWSDLHKGVGQFDFDRLKADIAAVEAVGKKLSIFIQWKFRNHQGESPVPQFIRSQTTKPIQYALTGVDAGHVAAMDNDAVAKQFVAMLTEMSKFVDDHPAVSGITFVETAVGTKMLEVPLAERSATRSRYYKNVLHIDKNASCIFKHTPVIQLTNWPEKELENMTKGYKSHGVGMGGPDVWLNDPTMVAYDRYDDVAGIVPIGLVVAAGNYDFVSFEGQKTEAARYATPSDASLTVRMLANKAVNELKANYVFWKRLSRTHPHFAEFLKAAKTLHTSSPTIPRTQATCPSMFSGICQTELPW